MLCPVGLTPGRQPPRLLTVKLKVHKGLERLPQCCKASGWESKVTKKDIVRTISEEVGLTQQQTKKIVQKTFDAIIDSLMREGRIELRNFGVFEVKTRAARKARNPRTGEEVIVPEKHVVTFKPGKYMESMVQRLDRDVISPPTDAKDSKTNNQPVAPPNHSGRWDTD